MYTRVDKFKTTESPVAVWQQDIKYRKWYNILHLFSQQATSLAGLATSRYLEELNLASNQISSFREILNLSRLAALRSLSLSDPHFGDNPICKLCNYQTHVTFHLNQLNSLDMEAISENAKRLCNKCCQAGWGIIWMYHRSNHTVPWLVDAITEGIH